MLFDIHEIVLTIQHTMAYIKGGKAYKFQRNVCGHFDEFGG